MAADRYIVRKVALFGWSILDTSRPAPHLAYGYERVESFGHHDGTKGVAEYGARRLNDGTMPNPREDLAKMGQGS